MLYFVNPLHLCALEDKEIWTDEAPRLGQDNRLPHVHARIQFHVCTSACMYVHMYACIYACMGTPLLLEKGSSTQLHETPSYYGQQLYLSWAEILALVLYVILAIFFSTRKLENPRRGVSEQLRQSRYALNKMYGS